MRRRDLITGSLAAALYAPLAKAAGNYRLKERYFRAPWTPGALGSSLVTWWSAQDTSLMVNDGSGLISNWKDRVTNLAVTATTTARGTWANNSFNSSYPGITFDGVANCYVTTTLTALPTGATAGEIWFVGSITNPGIANGRMISYGTGATASREVRQGVAGTPQVSDGTTGSTYSSTVFTPCIIKGDWSGTVENGYVNGSAFSGNPKTIATLATGTTRFRLGANNASGAGNFAAMVLSDAVVLSTVLSTSDRQKMEGYLAWNRGLTSALPASHPYKGAPP